MKFKYISGKKSNILLNQMHHNSALIYDDETHELAYFDPFNFVVGKNNKQGLKLIPYIKENMITAEYKFRQAHVGPPNLTHGGVLSAVCDDLMGLVCFCLNKISMTINLNVNYLNPVYLNQTYLIKAWLVQIDGKKIHCESIIYDQASICVEASGLFYLYDSKISQIKHL